MQIIDHLLAFYSASLGTSIARITPVGDNNSVLITASSRGFVFPFDTWLVGAYAGGTTLTRARVVIPGNDYAPLYIRPISATVGPTTDPNFMTLFDRPILLPARQEVGVEGITSLAGAATALLAVVGPERVEPPANEEVIWLRWSNPAQTLSVGAWDALTGTVFDRTLPNDEYGIVALDVAPSAGNSPIAARLYLPEHQWHPGALGSSALTNRAADALTYAPLGIRGTFRGNSPPLIEVLTTATGSSTLEGNLGVVRLSRGARPRRGR